jgi:hypothetical protein
MSARFPSIGEAPLDGTEYGRQSGKWVAVAAAGGVVPEAPTDGQIYGRQNGGWTNTNDIYLTWVPYTGPPQTFTKADLTRDGDWTMASNKATSDRPAPQPSGAEEDLLPPWTPATQSASGGYTVYNEWTLSSSGWIDQYGIDVLPQNTGATHIVTLRVNGVVKDTITIAPNTAGLLWQNITPIVTLSGAVLRVTVQVTRSGNNSWYQQTGLFATPPTYCSLAQGAKDAGAPGTTAYGCHLIFIPGTASPDWDVVAFAGAGGAGGATGAIKGVTDGSDAPAGYVGELLTVVQPSSNSLASATAANLVSMSLTPGDWDVWGYATLSFTVGGSLALLSVSITSATFGATGGNSFATASMSGAYLVAPMIRVNVTVNTAVYLVARGDFASGACTALANTPVINARRIR